MRIAFIITGLSTGGAEAMLFKLLQRIDRRKFTPYVISLTTEGDYGSHIKTLEIPILALNIHSGFPNPLKLLKLVCFLSTGKFDVVQTWMYHADLLGGIAARLAGIRAIVWNLRNSDLSPARSKPSTRIVVKLCAFVSGWLPQRILSCSKQAREAHVLAGYPRHKIVCIPNGFDLEHFVPDSRARISLREELGLMSDNPLIGLIARDDPQKNHLGFIKAATRVHAVMPDVHFVLAGKGVDVNNNVLLSAIIQAELRGVFHLLGRREDMPRLVAALDILASSSYGEAFPNVLGEAMACEVACVVTDVGDSAEIVGDIGRVVAPGDMPGLASHLIEFLQLSLATRIALGRQARQRVQARYEISDIVERYENFYLRLFGMS